MRASSCHFSTKNHCGGFLCLSLAKATRAPLKAPRGSRRPVLLCWSLPTLSTVFLSQPHCCCVLSTPKHSHSPSPFYFPFCFVCVSPNAHATWPLVWLKFLLQYYLIKEPVYPRPLWEKTLSFSVPSPCFTFLYDLVTNASIHFLMVCCFLPRVWTELKQELHFVHNP